MSDDDLQRRFAVQLVRITPPSDRDALRRWASDMLDLRERRMPVARKIKSALEMTHRAKVIGPLLKSSARQVKRHGWDNRSRSQRFGIGAAGTALAVFGTANAGLAALGGAIAVPLWVVFGAGAMFASHLLLDELTRPHPADADANYTVIDAERTDRES